MQPPSDQNPPDPPREQPTFGAPQTPPVNLGKTPDSPAPAPPPFPNPGASSTNPPPGFPNPNPTPTNTVPVQPARAGTVSMDVITEAWTLLKPEVGMWIAAALIYGAISGALNGVQNVVGLAIPDKESAPFLLLSLGFSVVGTMIGGLLGAGLFKMAIHHVRTGKADISQMFSVFDSVGAIIAATLLTTLAILLGVIACIIPGIIAALGLAMTTPVVVDQKVDAIEAIKRSWAAMKPNLGAFFVLCLVLFIINIGGFCACLIGLLFTIPLTQLALALVYRDLFGIGNASNFAPAPNYPPPPIASPGR